MCENFPPQKFIKFFEHKVSLAAQLKHDFKIEQLCFQNNFFLQSFKVAAIKTNYADGSIEALNKQCQNHQFSIHNFRCCSELKIRFVQRQEIWYEHYLISKLTERTGAFARNISDGWFVHRNIFHSRINVLDERLQSFPRTRNS